MVSWAGDGLISGYDPITKRLRTDLYHLATPGSVDLNGITRLGYDMGAGLSPTTYPNVLKATAPITFTSGDFSANPGKYLAAALYMVDAAYFPAGYIPKPSEIFALGDSKVNVSGSTLVATGPGTLTYDIRGFSHGFAANTKYWCLVLPVAITYLDGYENVENYAPIAGTSIDTIGRCVSLWTSRTPGKPTITSPTDGSIVLPGNGFNLKINPNDPDEVLPEDAAKYNDDMCGVQFQYATAPTADNPNPTWADLPYDVAFPIGNLRDQAWHIRGSGRGLGHPEYEALVANLGCVVVAGAGDGYDDYQPGKGALPSGEWQIRARTFDYGHPYPNSATDFSAPGPLGINLSTTHLIEPAKDSYPTVNTSPWSDPVRVSIPTQVPPPLALSPNDYVAVSGNTTVRLAWQYRNTHNPPRAQSLRTVQIRKVGDPTWATIFDGYDSGTYVDLPPVLTQVSVPDLQVAADGFETGFDGWSAFTGSNVLTRVNSPANAHSGNYYLQVDNATAGAGSIVRDITSIPAQYEHVDLSLWVYKNAVNGLQGYLQAWWKDAGGNDLIPDDPLTSPFAVVYRLEGDGLPSGWNKFTSPKPIHRPAGGVTLHLFVALFYEPSTTTPVTFRVDDISAIARGRTLDNFSMGPTTEYEWRVKVMDTDAVESNYSTPARFWVVPGAGTGGTREVPSNTINGATLGCGKHRVEIYRRGGLQRVGEIKNLSHVDWERKRDDISTAKVVVSGWDIDCGNLLANLQTWAYELVLWRETGYASERVWEGPITLLTYETDKVTIDAADVMRYAYRRIIKQKMSDAGSGNGTTVVDRARRVLQNAFAPDDPNVLAYLQVLARDDDSMQYRSTPAYSRTAFEEVDDMASNAGLDYTVVGRSIMLWGTKHRIGTLPEFKDENLGSSPIVSEYGMSFANRYVVTDGNGVWGEATRLTDGGDETYGLVEMLSSTWASDSPNESGTYTQAGLATVIDSFEHFAERSIADRYPPPVVVRIPDNTTLHPDTPISIQHLVPGVVVPLRSTKTLRTVVASQKLDSVKVVEEAGNETVSITLSPFSRDDNAVVEGA